MFFPHSGISQLASHLVVVIHASSHWPAVPRFGAALLPPGWVGLCPLFWPPSLSILLSLLCTLKDSILPMSSILHFRSLGSSSNPPDLVKGVVVVTPCHSIVVFVGRHQCPAGPCFDCSSSSLLIRLPWFLNT